MVVIKRDRKESSVDLVSAIDKLIPLLRNQKEDDAGEYLAAASSELRKAKIDTAEFKTAIDKVLEAFEGDHELIAYTHQRANASDWTEAEELSLASSRVLNLARRMKK